MGRYVYDVNYNRQKSAKRTARRVIIFIILLVVAGIGYLIYDAMRLAKANQGPSEASTVTTNVYNVPRNEFKTNFFEFDTNKNWTFAKKESKGSRWIYREVRNGQVRNEFIVYVNKSPLKEHASATRVLPARVGDEGVLEPTQVSDHCNKKAPHKDKVGEEIVKLGRVTFMCDNDATWYSVFIGLLNGTPEMHLRRSNGVKATYLLYFRAASADPNAADVIDVVRTFRAR